MTNQRLPKGITQRGSKFRVSIMVAGVRMTATCDTLVEAIQRAEAIRQSEAPVKIEKVAGKSGRIRYLTDQEEA